MFLMHRMNFFYGLTAIAFLMGCSDNDNKDDSQDSTSSPDTESDEDGGDDSDTFSPCVFRESIFDAPTGPYCVGAVDYYWTDPERDEPFTPDDDEDIRETAVRIFYPAPTDATEDFGTYVTPAVAEVLAEQVPVPGFAEALKDVAVQFRPNAPVADIGAPFPLLLFSPGWGMSFQESTALLEDMASRGYVIAAVNHPYFSGTIEFPDGRIIETFFPEDENDLVAMLTERFPLLIGDMKLVMDELSALEADDPDDRFTGRLDLDRVGAFGHSLGGAAALTLLQEDDRISAAIDMDGSLDYAEDTTPVTAPVMIHLAGIHTMQADPTVGDFWERLEGPGYAVSVEDAGHLSYTDWPVLIDGIYPGQTTGEENQGAIDPHDMSALVRDYNSAFFDVYLKGESAEGLADLEETYEESTVMEPGDPPPPEPTVQSLYLEMEDGTRIAADVWLPADADANNPVPAVIRATRYWRDIEVINRTAVPVTGSEAEATAWTEAGAALVLVDVRGTGASFGQWTAPCSIREIADLGEVVDWITAQEWSDGQVGAQGISYEGNTADFIGLLENDAVKVAAPLFSDRQIYPDVAYPGGIFNEGFIRVWNDINAALDANDICAIEEAEGDDCAYLKNFVSGVKPADEDTDHALLDAAVQEHKGNLDVYEAALNAPFQDSPIGEATYMDVSPAAYYDRMGVDAPFYLAYASWSDAATANSALSRYMTSENSTLVLIGPWSHGGDYNTDPFLPSDTPASPSYEEQVRTMITVFSQCFISTETPSIREIQYYTMGEGEWRTTDVWPPEDVTQTAFYLGDGGKLTSEEPTEEASSTDYKVDFTATTGPQNRWWTQTGDSDVIYPDRAKADEKLLVYTSAPMESDVRITGNPEVRIHLASTHEDGAIYVYLEDEAPDGTVTYLTDGELRVIHRKVPSDVPPYHVFGPYHSFLEADAAPMVPGEEEEIALMLQPIAAMIETGHAIRIALAGHDASNFARLPESGDPTLTIYHDTAHPSRIILPLN